MIADAIPGHRHGPLQAAAYVALYVFLDWISFIQPSGGSVAPGITPWNPAAGLAFAALLLRGLSFVPAVFVAAALANIALHGLSASAIAVVAATLTTAGYAAGAVLLRRRFQLSTALEHNADLLKLLAGALITTMLVAITTVTSLALLGLVDPGEGPEALLHFWIGDMIGIAVVTPFLLRILNGNRAPPHHGAAAEFAAQIAAIAAGLWIIFGESVDHFEYAYVLFLPLIWMALRGGLAGSTWGILGTQLGLILAIQIKGLDANVMTQFQLLMLAVAFSGLLMGAVVDERLRAESSLRDSEARLQSVLSTAPDAILTYDAAGTVTSVNRAAEQMFFAARGLPADTNIHALLPGLPAGDDTASGNELIACRLDGSSFVAEVAIGRTPGGQQDLEVCVVRDVSERKQAEAWLKEHEAALAQATRLTATGEMAAAIAHELNQPLTALIGFARACQTVLEGKADEAARKSASQLIDQAVRQALRAGEIVRSTREFVGRGDTHFTRVEIAQIFKSVLDLVRAEAGLRGVSFVARFEKGTPPVFADAIQIEQVIINLIRNSMEAMGRNASGVREISLSAETAADQTGFLEVRVQDTGPGFPPDIAERLFKPFATTKEAGMGLGLAISRSIVESHGGQIRAMPRRPGEGAEIHFTLPLYTDEPRDA